MIHKNIPNKVGLGLRSAHYQEILEKQPSIPWLEIHTENFFANGGILIEILEKIASIYPISFHGVSLSLGSSDGLNKTYLSKLKSMVCLFNPSLISEHLSWTSYNGIYTHDLLPLPYTKETLKLLCNNIDQVQNFLGREISIENPSSYLTFKSSDIPEDELLNQIADKTQCGILLDVNNIYVSGKNNGFDPFKYHVEKSYIREIHLAGHTIINTKSGKEMLIDTHDQFICTEVWKLYAQTIKRIGPTPTLIEWDKNLPPLSVLLEELTKAQQILDLQHDRHTRVTEKIS